MRSRTPLLFALAAAASMAGWGCADFTRGPPSPHEDAGTPTTPDAGGDVTDGGVALSFATDVHSVLLSRCQSCHSSGGNAADTSWVMTGDPGDDYATTILIVDEGSPAQSRLLLKGAGQGHVGGAALPAASDDYELVLTWIQQGALP